jgi:transcription elongation factor GreB
MAADEKNYITPTGLEKLKAEYQQLANVERPKLVETVAWAAGNGDRSENADYIYGKRRLREIDSRLRFLTGRLEKAEVVDPLKLSGDRVIFASTVTILDEEDVAQTYQIVGEYEWDVSKRKISWKSPVARALLGKKVGDQAIIQKPSGNETVEIQKIEFK